MALNKDVLGAALQAMAEDYNNIAPEDLESAKTNYWKGVAEQIIEHIKTAGEVNVVVNTTGTASVQTGTGTGSMS